MPVRRFCLLAAVGLCFASGLWREGRTQTPSPTPAEAAPDYMGAATSGKLQASRASFVESVKEGTLVAFDEAVGVVTFRPAKPVDTSHQPGPMEDEVIASAVRAGAVASPNLRGLKVKVECSAGALRLADSHADAAQTAELIQLALGVDGVREVCADLPHNLKLRPAS